MADTLAQLITKIQAQLLDNATLFSTATVTTAVRQALADLHRVAPLQSATVITTVANQLVYELSDYDAQAVTITAVLLEETNDADKPLPYDAYVEDARVFFRLKSSQPASENVIVQYTKPHTVSGLDSATDSTLTDALNSALVLGACAYCCLTRAAYTIELNNIEPDVTANWNKAAGAWRRQFDAALKLEEHKNTPAAEPTPAASNHGYHPDADPRAAPAT